MKMYFVRGPNERATSMGMSVFAQSLSKQNIGSDEIEIKSLCLILNHLS